MICIKTTIKEMPSNCKDCWVICKLPCKSSETSEEEVKEEYCNKRHEECPLVEITIMEEDKR